MRPDRLKERLVTNNSSLSHKGKVDKMVDLINLYHSIEHRYGSDEDKEEARELIRNELKKLRKFLGTHLAKNCLFYLNSREEWDSVKESFIS